MTTAQIEAIANAAGTATPGFPLQTVLRKVVVPQFLLDVQYTVGDMWWRRKQWSQAVTASTRNYAIPTDLDAFEELRFLDSTNSLSDPLDYIGDDPTKVLAAEVETTVATPTEFYLKETGVTTAPFALYLGAPPKADGTLKGRYIWTLKFTDETSEIDLDHYMPEGYQFPLIKALKVELFRARYGAEDGRWQAEKGLYDEDLAKLSIRKEPAHYQRAVFCR